MHKLPLTISNNGGNSQHNIVLPLMPGEEEQSVRLENRDGTLFVSSENVKVNSLHVPDGCHACYCFPTFEIGENRVTLKEFIPGPGMEDNRAGSFSFTTTVCSDSSDSTSHLNATCNTCPLGQGDTNNRHTKLFLN